MINLILQFYLKGLLISLVLVVVLSALYALAFWARHHKEGRNVIRNRFLDIILVAILTIPILSFAVLGLLVILSIRRM